MEWATRDERVPVQSNNNNWKAFYIWTLQRNGHWESPVLMGGNNKCGKLIPPMTPNDPGLMPVRYGIGYQFAHATALLFNVERI